LSCRETKNIHTYMKKYHKAIVRNTNRINENKINQINHAKRNKKNKESNN